jgi:hypothetical protein
MTALTVGLCAIRDYDRAIELDPSYAGAFYNRRIAKLKNGKVRDGNADIVTAKAVNFPDRPLIRSDIKCS